MHDYHHLDTVWIHVKILQLGKAELIRLMCSIIMGSLDPQRACSRGGHILDRGAWHKQRPLEEPSW
jgi:hypothetical protein